MAAEKGPGRRPPTPRGAECGLVPPCAMRDVRCAMRREPACAFPLGNRPFFPEASKAAEQLVIQSRNQVSGRRGARSHRREALGPGERTSGLGRTAAQTVASSVLSV